MRLQFWAADTLRFSVTGPEPHRFLNRAAAAGVRLRRVRWQRDGYAATVSGADRRRLDRIARDGGWTLAVTARRGPGKHTERLLQTRPAIGGNILATIETARHRPQMATVRPHSTAPAVPVAGRRGEIDFSHPRYSASPIDGLK